MVVFNGGPKAGSSVAHKHLQVFPRPEWRTIADEIVDGKSRGNVLNQGRSWHRLADHGTYVAILPFQNRLVKLPQQVRTGYLFSTYQRMCKDLAICAGDAHNLLLVKEWMMVMPRSTGLIQGEIADAPLQSGANGMIGMLWLKSYEQLENWKRYGPMEALTDFGKRSSPF